MPVYIGKESDSWENDEDRGPDDPSMVDYGSSTGAEAETITTVRATLTSKATTHSKLARAALISEHTVASALRGDPVDDAALRRLAEAALRFSSAQDTLLASDQRLLCWARARVAKDGLSSFSARVPYDAANLGKVLAGRRKMSKALRSALHAQYGRSGDQ